jgi:hypothetical protein
MLKTLKHEYILEEHVSYNSIKTALSGLLKQITIFSINTTLKKITHVGHHYLLLQSVNKRG